MKSTWTRIVCVAAALALVVGCGGDDDSNGGSSSGGGGGGGEEVSSNPSEGVTDSEIVIGWMGDLTGPTASAQSLNYAGFKAYMDKVNDEGGLAGRQISISAEDDQCSAESGVANFQKLLNDVKVLAIVNGSCSAITEAVSTDVEANGLPVIGPGQTTDVQLENPYFFNNMAHSADQADVSVARLVQRIGDAEDVRAVVMQLEIPSGDEFNSYAETALENAGATYAGRITMPLAASDMVPVVSQLKGFIEDQDVNGILMHANPAVTLAVLDAMDRAGVSLPINGIGGVAGRSIYTEGPEALLDLPEGASSFLPANTDAPGAVAMREYLEGTDEEQNSYFLEFAHGWVNGMILTQAIDRAVVDSGELGREALAEALRGPFETEGMTCPIDWSESNHSPCAIPFSWDGENLTPVGTFDEWSESLSRAYQGG